MKERRRWRGTVDEAAVKEKELRALGLIPVQPIRSRIKLLQEAALWPVTEGPLVQQWFLRPYVQMHLWLQPEVATLIYAHPIEARSVLHWGRGRPFEERQERFRAAASILLLGGTIDSRLWEV